MRKGIRKMLALCLVGLGIGSLMAQPGNVPREFVIDVQKVGSVIQEDMYGVFFEDINFGADGGLYAELIKNRSFEFENPLSGWTPFGSVSIQAKNPCFDKNPNYVRLSYNKELTGTGLDNEGFKGIGVKAGEKYDFSLYARTVTAASPITLRIELVDANHNLFETKKVEIDGKNWKKYEVTLTPQKTEAKARLRITMETKGAIDLEHISLFPQKTYKNRKNGLREDLAQALEDLNTKVFRFPGGCIVEGALLLKMMAKKEQVDEKKAVNPHGKKPAKTTYEQQEYVLSSISGIGPNAAKLLLNEFGSLNHIFNATEEELCRVKGIGKVTAQRIRSVMDAEYKK